MSTPLISTKKDTLNINALLAFLVLMSAWFAHATPIAMAWSDSWGSDTDDVYLSKNGTAVQTITFDITTDGFNPNQDFVWNYVIDFGFYDDGDKRKEKVKINQQGPGGVNKFSSHSLGNLSVGSSLFGWYNINTDGLLKVLVEAKKGDFWFADATLHAKGIQHSVPETSSIALLLLGLAGLVVLRRKQ